MILDLSGPRLKLARAKHHIRDLESLFDAFVSDNPHRIEIEANDEGIRIVGKFDRPIPVETSAIIGDAIHNIRASLDHLVAAAVRSNRGEPTRFNGFPFYKEKTGFDGGVANKLAGCTDAFITYIKNLEPYPGGYGEGAYNISEMDNLDKHITLLPTIAVSSLKNITITYPDGTRMLTIGELNLSGDGHMDALHAGGKGLKFEADTQPTFAVRFKRDDVDTEPEVIDFLQKMRQIASDIIEKSPA